MERLTVMRYFCIDLSHDSSSNLGSTNEVTPQNAGPKMSNRPIVGMHVNSWTKTHAPGIYNASLRIYDRTEAQQAISPFRL
jgi:hypothetical protein